jgi:sugar lactone lactonase YvrE
MIRSNLYHHSFRILPITAALLVLVLALLVTAAMPAAAAAPSQDVFPPVIPLPNGFQPEGIALGYGTTFYVGSIPTGAIYRGDLRTGEGEILVEPQAGRAAIGMKFDPRSGYLFVAGGPTGKAFVYDGSTGELLAEYTFTAPSNTFINDVTLTQDAAYFTNSSQPFIYRVPLGQGGSLPDPSAVLAIPLTGDYVQQPGFNANGIAATPDGQWLIIVQSNTGKLFRVDPQTGVATQIELAGGATVLAGDGIWLEGQTLYVVQNALNQISVIDLSPDLTSGTVVDVISNVVTEGDFRTPTTITRFGPYLYAVNARFGAPATSDTEYWVVQVRR